MKIATIIAMLAAFALVATPLWTVNAAAETIEDPAVIDTTGADWDYRVYGDADGYIIMADRSTEIHYGDYGFYMFGAPSTNEVHGADWDYRVYGDANGFIICGTKNNEIHGDGGGINIIFKDGSDGKTLTGDDGGAIIIFASPQNEEIHGDGGGFIICSKGFNSIIRNVNGSAVMFGAPSNDEIHGENGTEPARMGGKIALCFFDSDFNPNLDNIMTLIKSILGDDIIITGIPDDAEFVTFVGGDDQQPIILGFQFGYGWCILVHSNSELLDNNTSFQIILSIGPGDGLYGDNYKPYAY
ncbi:MAG: hypothetical protein R6W91_03090 [Thermoplasmata archaeon]